MAAVRRVALTGGIATGKSHVRARFETLGTPTIDADVLARQAVAPGSPALDAVVRRFGAGILEPGGVLDRRKLGRIVFDDPEARRALEEIVHPVVRRQMSAWFESLDGAHAFAVADIPLLFEAGRDRDFEKIVVTACAPATQIRRIMDRDGMTEAEARQRVQAQLPLDEKVARADHVIRTDGTIAETNAQVEAVYLALKDG